MKYPGVQFCSCHRHADSQVVIDELEDLSNPLRHSSFVKTAFHSPFTTGMWIRSTYIFLCKVVFKLVFILWILLCKRRLELLILTFKRSVMIIQEMCPIRAEISTHKHLGICIYLLFVLLAVIGFRQKYFYILPNFGDVGAKMSFFHYIINQKQNNFIKHCPPPCTKKPLISEMSIYIKS